MKLENINPANEHDIFKMNNILLQIFISTK